MDILIVSLASLMAGLVDAIVGGGGLILLPALFAVFPQAAPATLFGSNKSASIWGTAFASYQYSRKVQLRTSSLWPAAIAGLLGSLAGAWTVTQIDPGFLRKLLPILLALLLLYTLARKDLGRVHAPRWTADREARLAAGIGLVIGFYDGFFGPGTGSFLVFAFVRLLGYDVFVEFSFARPDLRADSELEAFRSMKQSRVLDLLSLGLITDDEAALQLTGKLPPASAPKLSGTMFRSSAGSAPAQDASGNPYSNTSQSTFGKATAPDTPQAPKGNPNNAPMQRVK